ncbi:MAG: sugar ABC transporter permease [Ruminococcus sp.]|nr:sugar ABC transporter permease [Ruminococcus sp.]
MIKSYKFRRHLSNFIIYLILGVMCIIWIMPFVYLVLHSLRLDGGVIDNGALLPKQLTFQHYIDLFAGNAPSGAGKATLYFPQWFTNTFIVACFSCVISTLSVLAVSYTFSRLRFGVRKTLMNIAMILGMFPGFMTMIAMYYLLKIMHLDGTLFALVLCYSCGAGLGFQISKGFFDTIPRALDEAATIDGATKNQIFWKIILPMSKPIVVYTVLTAFIGPWTDFILAKIIMGDDVSKYTVAIGLQKMISAEFRSSYFQQFMAGSVVVAIPITLLFLKMQKYYVGGVTAGGVKG